MTDITQKLRNTYFTFLTYNEQINPLDAAVSFVKGSMNPGQISIIVTNHKDEVSEIINSTFGSDTTVSSIDYDSIDNLYPFGSALVVFDNFDFLKDVKDDALKEFLVTLYNNNNTVVALTNKTTSEEDIEDFSDMFTMKPFFGSLNYISEYDGNGDLITYEGYLVETELTDYQIDYYRLSKDVPNADSDSWQSDNFKDFVYIFNIIYPFEIQKLIDSGDAPDIQTLIKLFGWENLLAYGPKIKYLVDIINLRLKNDEGQNMRHVIFTALDDYHGAYLLEGIFENSTINGNGINSITIHSEDDLNVQEQKMDLFNNQKDETGDYFYQVLILTKSFPQIPKDINFFHTLDTDLLTASKMIDQVYKTSNYSETNPINLKVYMHVTKNETNTIDNYLASGLLKYIEDSYFVYNQRFKKGFKIGIGNGGRLIVQE